MKKTITLFFLFLIIYSCTKDKSASTSKTSTNVPTQDVATLTSFLAQSLQVNENTIVFDKKNEVFRIQGDMLITKYDAESRYQNKPKESKSATVAQRVVSLVSDAHVTDIRVYSSVVNADWTAAIIDAINGWNALNTLVHFRLVSANENHDIFIGTTHAGAGSTDEMAEAYLPSDGKAGSEMNVNIDYTGPSKAAALLHEFGHTVGLAHTDGWDGVQIPGTPTSDPTSIMNSHHSGEEFTWDDVHAINILYPHPPIPIHVIGPSVICGSGTTIYTTDKPIDASSTWIKTGTAGSIPSPSTGYNVVLTPTGNGDLILNATVTPGPYDYHTYFVVPLNVHIGPPTLTFTQSPGCDDETVEIRLSHPGSTATSISYTDTDGTLVSGLGDNFDLPPHVSTVDITLTNICGTVTLHKHFVRMLCH